MDFFFRTRCAPSISSAGASIEIEEDSPHLDFWVIARGGFRTYIATNFGSKVVPIPGRYATSDTVLDKNLRNRLQLNH
jgi:hypothetical protein